MLIIDKILDKKTINFTPEKVLDRSISFNFDDGTHFLTVEELTNESYILFINKKIINDLHNLLGINKEKINSEIFQWFNKKYKLETIKDFRKLYK